VLVGLDGFHVVGVAERTGRRGPWLRVEVETAARAEGCRSCGVLAAGHGRRTVRLIDTPCFGRPVELRWRKRVWRCEESACAAGAFTEQQQELARPRALLSLRACWWAIRQLRREHASVAGPAARHDLADPVARHPTAAAADGRRRVPLRRCHRPGRG
jgi:transposase